MRSFLRADPDVIMIGEMRDSDDGQDRHRCRRSPATWCFSTLHTNNAPETVVRLIEMGIDPYNFADCLARHPRPAPGATPCAHSARRPTIRSRDEYDDLVKAYGAELFGQHRLPDYTKDLKLMRGKGCDACEGAGVSAAAIAIHELLVNSPADQGRRSSSQARHR
ncbi:MAG: Flp pilus assembly complex ATPase component TadA [Desulfomicrobium escambiense]|nr:Flp pilus assembly complex ATPase component TadA [Desulfomicrobium escambiense]